MRVSNALKRRNVLMAVAAAQDLPQLSLADALELTVLVTSGSLSGRGWDRTSDLPRVKRALSR
jgi:hypothetical protein